MLDQRIKFDSKYIDDEYETVTLYFSAPKVLLFRDYPDAESMMISLEYPKNDMNLTSVEFSPVKNGECYDWFDVDISKYEIDELIQLAERR